MKYKEYIILISVIIIAAAAYALLPLIPSDNKTTDSYNYFKITDTDPESIKEIEITNPDETYTFSFGDEIYLKELNGEKINEDKANRLRSELSSLTTHDNAFENAGSLKEYGLDFPGYYARMTDKDGRITVISVGSAIPGKEKYYTRVNNENKIYETDYSLLELISRRSSFYRVSEFETIDFSAVSEVILEIYGKPEMKFKEIYVPDVNTPHNVFNKMEMTAPYHWPAMSEEVGKIVDSVSDIEVISYPADNLSEKEKYGFSPYKAAVTVIHDGKKTKFLIGKSEGDTTYLIEEGKEKIIGVSCDCFKYLELEPFNFVSGFAFLKNIDTVKNISYNHNNKLTVFKIKKSGEEQYDVKMNGKLMSYNDFQELYTELISIMLDGPYEGAVSGEPFLSYTFEYNDKTYETAEYYKIDERRAAFSLDGVIQFYVSIPTLEEKLKIIDGLMNN